MPDPISYPFFSEFYMVEKSAELVVSIGGEEKRIRVDVLRDAYSTEEFSTKSYISEDFTIQPTYPQENGISTKPSKSVRGWVDYDLPWTSGASADNVLAQALSFLEERCRGKETVGLN